MQSISFWRFTHRMLALALVAPVAAHATVQYNKWVSVAAPASTGAACGNGSVYHYFVNRAPNASKTLIYFEGGGACWGQHDCLGKGKFSEVATNPNGVPSNYLSQLNLAAFGMISPMIWRTSFLQKTVTQSWNLVYVPYCTGDVHIGNAVNVYKDEDPNKPLTYYHRGYRNVKEVGRWVAQNVPTQELLVSGFSAGSSGATAAYAYLRDTIKPARSSLLADAGPLMPTPAGGSKAQYPSLPLHTTIAPAWGIDRPDGIRSEMISRYPQASPVRDNIGATATALAQIYPQDRFGYTVMQTDGIFSAFSYRHFYPELAAISHVSQRDAAYNKLWVQDLANWTAELSKSPNVGFYVPYFRPLIKSHTLTTLDYAGTGIEERGLKNVETFILNTLDRSAPPIRAIEQDHVSDKFRLVDGIQWLVKLVENFFV